MRLTFLILAFSIIARSGLASAAEGVVLVVGKAPPHERSTTASSVSNAARTAGWSIVESPFVDKEVDQIAECLNAARPWPCVSGLTLTKNIERLIVVRIEPSRAPDGSPALTLTEHILISGADIATADQRFCAQCTDETLTRTAFDLTKELLEEASSGTNRTTIMITSTPPGAWITLDGKTVGLTDRLYSTFPGKHTVMLQRFGYVTEVQKVDVSENQRAKIEVNLKRVDGATTEPGGEGHPHLVPAIVIGAGVVAVLGGTIVSFTVDSPSTGQQPEHLYSGPGIALAIGGGVAVAAGIYLWRRATRSSAASAPTASMTSNGGFVGWAGRF